MSAPARPQEDTYERRFDLSVWRKLFAYTRPYRRQVALLVLFAIGTATVDVCFPLVTRRVVDDVAANGTAVKPGPYIAAFLALTAALSLFVWAFIRQAGKIRTYVSHDIRRDGFENLQRLSFSFYDQRPVGWLMARMTSDCERLSNIMAWGILDLFWGTTLMTGIAVVMLVMSPKLAVLVLAVVPALALASALFQKRILSSARIVRKTNSRITASFNETIQAVRTTKVFVRERENLDDFRGLTGEMYAASVRNAVHSALYLPVVLTLGSVATGAALGIGGFRVAAGTLTVGTLIAFMTYIRHFFDPVQEMAHWFAEMQMAQASAERVLSLVEAEPEIRDSSAVLARTARRAEPDGFSRIEFRSVGFRYAGGERVLDGFDLEVRAGETIALVGPTGGGKTTIVSLLGRFYEPTEGSILFDGVDYRERSLAWLRSRLAVVLQEPHLFSGTVEENVRYGRLDATRAEIEEAARLAGALDFVEASEHGFATQVGEGGSRLSTGQKQLVSFARAILARPSILVMDEATSSIDTETERRIQAGLARVLEGRTSFVIAHRLSTVRSADRILVIDGGRIVEQGDHAALLARRGRYWELTARQRLRETTERRTAWRGGPGEAAAPA